MTDPNHLFDLVTETDKLKSVYRRTYLLDQSRNENSAEHSWHLCVALLAMEPQMPDGVDLDHAIRLALAHDICEIGAGDVSVYSAERDQKHPQEKAYMEAFEGRFGAMGARMNEHWQEYERQETPESRWVKVVDRLQPFIMNLATQGRAWQEQGIAKDQVVAVNELIARDHPELFAWMVERMDEAVAHGWLKPARPVE